MILGRACFNTGMDTLDSHASREMAPSLMQNPRPNWLLLTLAALLALLIVGEAFFAWNAAKHGGAPEPIAPPSGVFYLSMAPSAASSTAMYSFEVSSKTLSSITAPRAGSDWSPTITPDGVVYASSQTASGTLAAATQLFSLNTSGSVTQLSDIAAPWKRSPQYSATLGKIVYEGKLAVSSSELNSPSGASVYLLVDKKEAKYMTTGSLPSLTPDGKSVVVLRNDGLYLTSLVATSTTDKIWGFDGGTASTQDQFSISPDGKYIAWSIPEKGHIYVAQVDSWAPFSKHLVSDIAVTALWPQFSPDDQYLAYIAIDLKGGTPSNARLVAQTLFTGVQQTLQDLSNFDASTIFLSGWGR